MQFQSLCRSVTGKDWNTELFVHHKAKNTHHGGTSLVQFNSTLPVLVFVTEFVPAEIDQSITEVTNEFVFTSRVLHYEKFQESAEEENLSEGGRSDVFDGLETVADIVESPSGEIDVSVKTVSGVSPEVSNNGKHTDTSVFEFDVTKTVEPFLACSLKDFQGIVETK